MRPLWNYFGRLCSCCYLCPACSSGESLLSSEVQKFYFMRLKCCVYDRSAGIHEKYLAQIERKIHQMQHISAWRSFHTALCKWIMLPPCCVIDRIKSTTHLSNRNRFYCVCASVCICISLSVSQGVGSHNRLTHCNLARRGLLANDNKPKIGHLIYFSQLSVIACRRLGGIHHIFDTELSKKVRTKHFLAITLLNLHRLSEFFYC